MIRALVFDFDGLILETEKPIFQSYQEVYRKHGQELSFDKWAKIIGTADTDYDPLAELEKLSGMRLDREGVEARRRAREMALILAQPIQAGVKEYLEKAKGMGLKVGLASSSSCAWVEEHLTRLGLIEFFDCIKASDDVKLTKPDPALYREAVNHLRVAPDQTVAFEDSPNGIRAAKSAGLFCMAVPNDLTRQLSLAQADLCLESLETIPLEQLLVEVARRLEARRKL